VNERGAFVFAPGVAEPTPTGPTAAQATAPAPPAAQAEEIDSAFDAAQEELVASLSVDLTPVEPAPKAPPSEAEATAAPSEAPKFDPMEVGDDLYPGLAFALNRAAEGIVLAPPAPASSRGEQWAQAIRLTREAAFAWANLLHGPAVVAIEH
jgi:hypothetical protein